MDPHLGHSTSVQCKMTMPTNVLHLLLVRLKLASNILKSEKFGIFQNLEKLDFVLGGGWVLNHYTKTGLHFVCGRNS